jgi:hypothetical protein
MLECHHVLGESILAREFSSTRGALVYNPQVSFFNVPPEILFVELLVTRSPSAQHTIFVCPVNSMNLTQMSVKIAADNEIVAMQSICTSPQAQECLLRRMGPLQAPGQSQ